MKKIIKYEEFKLDEGILDNVYNRTFKRKQIDKLSKLAVELILTSRNIAQSISSNNKYTLDKSLWTGATLLKKVKEKFFNSMPIDIKFSVLEEDEEEVISSNVHINDPVKSRLLACTMDIKMIPKKDLSCLIVYYPQLDYSYLRDPGGFYFMYLFTEETSIQPFFQLTESNIESKREMDRFTKNCLIHILALYCLNYLNQDNLSSISSIIKLLSKTKKHIVASEKDIQEFILDTFESKYKKYFKVYKTLHPSVADPFACAVPMTQKSEEDIPRGMILDLISIIEIISKPFDYLMKLKNTELIISEISKESSDAFHKIEQSLPPEYRYKATLNKDMGDLGF